MLCFYHYMTTHHYIILPPFHNVRRFRRLF
jgi:hypothetical protein